MKKALIVFLCLGIVVSCVLFSGCSVKSSKQTINYKRRLQNYIPAETSVQRPTGTIDLSDGQKLKYDRTLGPNDLNFDITIKNPY